MDVMVQPFRYRQSKISLSQKRDYVFYSRDIIFNIKNSGLKMSKPLVNIQKSEFLTYMQKLKFMKLCDICHFVTLYDTKYFSP